jgi:hypothetical protein
MHIGYVDEAGNEQALQAIGDDGTPVLISDAAPLLAVGAIFVSRERRDQLFHDFLRLKKRVAPQALVNARHTDLIRFEIKGSGLRQKIRRGDPREARWVFSVLDQTLDLLRVHDVTISAHVWIKKIDETLGRDAYPTSIAHIAGDLHRVLEQDNSPGWLIVDSRTKVKNEEVVHTISTRKCRTGGDMLPLIVEPPVFGHSDTHALLQITDLIVSALIYPMACIAYCEDLAWNVHVAPAFERLQARYGAVLRSRESRLMNNVGKTVGGIVVRDLRHRRPTRDLFGGHTP